MDLLGTKLDTNDPQVYVVAWALLTLLLVIIASRLGSFAVTTALVVVFAVWMRTYGNANYQRDISATSGAGGGSGKRS